MFVKVVILFAFSGCISCFFFDDPCDVFPIINVPGIPKDPDFTVNTHVPAKCMNGSLRWDYPRGHVMLHFPNHRHLATTVCFTDSLGGDVFTLTDVSQSTGQPLGSFTMDKPACTQRSTASDITVQIDAPKEEQRYMGAVKYVVTHG